MILFTLADVRNDSLFSVITYLDYPVPTFFSKSVTETFRSSFLQIVVLTALYQISRKGGVKNGYRPLNNKR